MITDIRTVSQQLLNPLFDNPKELVSWMGAVQAQNYSMAKWAVGVRTKDATIDTVEQSLRKGEILRTHILRPTWHFVSSGDIRWMLNLTGHRVCLALKSWCKKLGISDNLYTKTLRLFEKILDGNEGLTKQEIFDEFVKKGFEPNADIVNSFILYAESQGFICSGVEKNGNHTYALLDERVPLSNNYTKEESLAMLATKYFCSHSPASLQDFTWWSGLSISEAKQAVKLIEHDLIADRYGALNLFVHHSYAKGVQTNDVLHFLPSYDEYLISYKDRSTVMKPEFYHKAFNNFGIFQPVILYNGQIVGNWKKMIKKGEIYIEHTFFKKEPAINSKLIKAATKNYNMFYSDDNITE